MSNPTAETLVAFPELASDTSPANDDDPPPASPSGRTPFLSAETETNLLTAWIQHRDRKAVERLVVSYQPLVAKMASQFRRCRLPMADLVAEGNVGLMLAISKFDPAHGVRLSTYAMWWIRAAINDYVLASSSVVKAVTTEHHKRLFFNLGRLKARLQYGDCELLTDDGVRQVASRLAVSEDDVVRMDRWLCGKDLSINVLAGEEDAGREWQEALVDPSPDQEQKLMDADEQKWRRAALADALASLDDRERIIVRERFLADQPRRLVELGERFGITRERVRQIETRALHKLQKRVRENAAHQGLWSAPTGDPAERPGAATSRAALGPGFRRRAPVAAELRRGEAGEIVVRPRAANMP
jgi:RNA polymerase sigma-32 factor